MPSGFSYIGNMRVQEDSGELVSQSVGASALLTTVCDGSSLEVNSQTGKLQIKVRGDAMTGGVPRENMSRYAGSWIRGDLVVSAATAGVFQVQNTTGVDLIIDRVLIHIVTISTEDGAVLDVGMGSGASTSYDNLIDGVALTVVGAFDNLSDDGTNGKSRQLWEDDYYVNASCFDAGGSAESPAALVGYYAIHVIDLAT